MNIAIVIPCFKRTQSLSELCQTLLNACYDGDTVSLVFSVDYSGTDSVAKFADAFEWPYGPKRVIEHETNIGLRNNIISCGDLTDEYDAVIVIEDDLEVAPSFYRFAKGAAEFYENDDRIGGVSIYHYYMEEITRTLFLPIYEGYDAYFVQWASSWGQLWTKAQWRSFKAWYEEHQDISTIPIPMGVRYWTHSWKKYYIAYLADTNRYFVFPFVSQIYNGNKDSGVHTVNHLVVFESSPFDISGTKEFRLPDFDAIQYKYDAYFQLMPRIVTINDNPYKVEFDLLGHKEQIKEDYVITSRKCNKEDVIESFDAGMIPLECNILTGKKGNVFHLIPRKAFNRSNGIQLIPSVRIRRSIEWKQYLPLYLNRLLDAVKRHLK